MGKVGNTELYTFLQSIATDDYFPITRKSDGKLFNVPIGLLFGLIDGGELPAFDQNNTFKLIYPNGSRSGFENVHEAINASSPFEILETEVGIVQNFYQSRVDSQRVGFVTDYYLMMSGKGNYGFGEDQLDADDFFLLRSNRLATVSTQQPEPLEVEYLTVDSFDLPHIAINGSDDQYEVIDGRDTFFVLTEPSQQRESPRKIYRFVGEAGTYGNNGTATSFSDFLLVEDLSGVSDRTSDQNNLVVERPTDPPTRTRNIADAINQGSEFTVAEDEIFIIANRYEIPTDVFRSRFVTDYYLFKKGKGTYGNNRTAQGTVTVNDFFFLRTTSVSLVGSNGTSNPPVVETLSYINIDNPHLAVNNATRSFEITNDTDTFFVIQAIVRPVGTLPSKIYRFVGEAGNYGDGGIDAVLSDFLLVEDLSSDPDTGQIPSDRDSGIIVREILLPTRLDQAGGGVANAVNSSFRGILTARENELVRFIAQEAIAIGSSRRLDTVRYDWKKGAGQINDGSAIDSDFSFVDRIFGNTLIASDTSENPIQILDLKAEDISEPQDALNSFETPVVVNNNDLYLRVYFEDTDAREPQFNLYRFGLGNGTYGQGNTQVTKLDLVLVEEFDSTNVSQSKTPFKKLFGEINVMGVEGNEDRFSLESGDTVVMTNLRNNILLIHGDYGVGDTTSSDPLDLGAYNPDTANYFDRNDVEVSLTSFQVDVNGDRCNPNGSTQFTTTYYHSGANTAPALNAIIYSDPQGTVPVTNSGFVYQNGMNKVGIATNSEGRSVTFSCF